MSHGGADHCRFGVVEFATTIAPGVTYTEYSLAGPNKVYVVAVDLSHPEYKLEVGWNGKHRNFGSCGANCTSCTGALVHCDCRTADSQWNPDPTSRT